MRTHERFTVVLGLIALVGADRCVVATAPVDAANVRIVLAVSGGIAGVDWQVTIDGAGGRVVGDRCRDRIACDWDPGDVLGSVTDAEVVGLADRFFEARFFSGDADHGVECCDQFEYALTYEDEDEGRTVTGSDGTLPDRIRELVAEVRAFVESAQGG